MRTRKMINLMAGLFFTGIFCFNSGAFGYAPSGEFRTVSEVVFVDPSVRDAEIIVFRLPRGAEVVRLLPGMDGVRQISAHLAGKRDLSAIRVISHGSAGYFVLNGNIIDSEYLAENSKQISSWGNSLSEDADIMLYGCNVAATAEGRALVRMISGLTGADVAASTDMTGGTGNWDLEYQDGRIEAAAIDVESYKHHLDTHTVTSNANAGPNTLRQAIIDAGDGDTIAFNLAALSETITITEDLDITKSLTIDGDNTAGSGTNVTVQVTTPGTSNFRVFNIDASGKTVTIQNMTIKGGDISGNGDGPAGYGGGIYAAAVGTLELDTVTVSNSNAYAGGGIYHNNGTLTFDNSTASDNTAIANGGGIYYNVNESTYTSSVENSTISENTAAYGGGIQNVNGHITIEKSTISNNSAGSDGAGIYSSDNTRIYNSTISHNKANAWGGGIRQYTAGELIIENSTIANNHADFDGDDNGGGGGYFAEIGVGVGDAHIRNTIIANNIKGVISSTTGDDYCYYIGNGGGELNDNGYNVVEYQSFITPAVWSTTTAFDASTSILYNYDYLGNPSTSWTQGGVAVSGSLNLSSTLALNDSTNGTDTLALAAGSFAAGSATTGIPTASTWNGSPATDQRGVARTADQNTSIGAYSANYATLATTTPISFDCSVTKVEMHNGTDWVTIFTGTAALDVVPGGTFPGVSDLSLPAGTYSQIRVTFTNAFPLQGSQSYGGTTYYTTAATFGGQTNLASTPTQTAGELAEFTFRIEAWGAINTEVPQTFAITPVTVNLSTDYQPTVRVTISDKLLLKGTDGTPLSYYFALSAPTVSIVEP